MGACRNVLEFLSVYQTVKLVEIKSRKLGILHYGIQFSIFVYLIVFVIILSKGYQQFDNVLGNVSVKLKGNSYLTEKHGGVTIWDATDVVQPPMEKNAAFVTTNYIVTTNQTRRVCPGNNNATELCSLYNGKCPVRLSTTNGVTTGTCSNKLYCDIYAWCTPEVDVGDESNTLDTVKNFTVFVRVDVTFPLFGIDANNIKGKAPTLGTNLFHVSDIVEGALKNPRDPTRGNWSFDDVKLQGALLATHIHWDCNFDFSPDACRPEISFVRLDNVNSFSPGFNFRNANYYRSPEGILTRDLYKRYGVRLVFLVTGRAGKFDIVSLLQNIGSGIALLTLASVVADFLALNIMHNKNFFREVKMQVEEDPDDIGPLIPGTENSPQNVQYETFGK